MTDIYADEYKPFCSIRDDGRFLIHVVALPDADSGNAFCTMSRNLLDAVSDESSVYYHLVETQQWDGDAVKIYSPDEAKDLTASKSLGKASYPHMTFFHVWMTFEEASAFMEGVYAHADRLAFNTLHPTKVSHIVAPHWVGGVPKQGQMNDIYWVDVDRSIVMPTQGILASIAREKAPDCQIITAIGEKWNPHFTILGHGVNGQVLDFHPAMDFAIHGRLAIGVSGWHGQFRASAALFDGIKPMRPLDKVVDHLERICVPMAA